jgi:hypothetical protein
MEDIFELWHCLVSFFPQCGPFGIQVVITSNRVVLFLNNILKDSHVVMNVNNEGSSVSFFSQKVSHQYLTWGTALRSTNIIFSLFKKLSLVHIVKISTFYLQRYGQNCPYCRKIEEI